MVKCGLQEMPSFKLVCGVGNYDAGQACVISAAVACWRLKNGEPLGKATDEMDCCCPVIRSFLIRLNDSSLWRDDDHRTDVLMPFVSRLAETRNPALVGQRAFMLADWAVRTIAADAMGAIGLPEEAAKLRALAEITDQPTAAAAAYADADARYADADARYAAARYAAYADAAARYAAARYAAARYAAARYAAYAAAAYAAADAAYAAAAYAACAADDAAAYAAAARGKIIEQCVAILDRMLALSE